MRLTHLKALAALGILAACGSVQSTTYDSITVDGRAYELRTQVIQSGDRSFVHSSVKVRNQYYICLKDSPGSCEAAVRNALSRFDRSGSR